jgi:enoyl-CoA hydratase
MPSHAKVDTLSVLREQQGQVLTLTINRPDARNSLNPEVLEGLVEGLQYARDDDGVRVVVLTGAGEKAFCAGADLGSGLTENANAVDQHEQRGALRRLFEAAERLDKPLVGRVNGHALAGGLGVALACDLLVTVEDAAFGTPEVRVGLWPYVISALITEHVGPKRALELMMTGRRLSAGEAREWGLVNQVVPREQLDETVEQLTSQLIAGAPLAMALGRRSYHQAREMSPSAAMAYLHGMLDLTVQTEDVVEGVTAFFEKREANWKGR